MLTKFSFATNFCIAISIIYTTLSFNVCLKCIFNTNIHSNNSPILPSNHISSQNTNFKIYSETELLTHFNPIKSINNSEITLNHNYISYLSTLDNIPKTFHIAWNDKNVLNSNTEIIKYGIKSFIKYNPQWKVKIYNDSEIEAYIKDKIPYNEYLLIKPKHIIEKLDLWRLLVMYFEGGLYQDIDRMFNINLDEYLYSNGNNIKLLLPTHYNVRFSQDFMCSSPNNPLFKLAIELNLSKRRLLLNDTMNNILKVLYMGPDNYVHAITNTLFGRVYEKLSKENLEYIRYVLNNTKYMRTYDEKWCNTIVFHIRNGSELNYNHCMKINKKPLWKEYNKIQWSKQITE